MADLDFPTNQLRIALISRDVEGVKAAIKAGADITFRGGAPVNSMSWEGDDPVCREIMRILLEAGANPNKADDGPSPPPLATASVANSTVMVEMLLKAGANPNVSFGRYKSVLDYAVQVSGTPNNRNIKLLCEVTNYDEVERLQKNYPRASHRNADLLNYQPRHTKAEIAERVSPAMAGLNKTAKKQYGFETEFPNIEKNISEYAFRERKDGSGRRKTRKHKSSKKKTKKRK